jgi:hypothetical protein
LWLTPFVRSSNIDPFAPNVTVNVTVKEEKAGSPAYRVGYGAEVEIIEDLTPRVTGADAA